MHVLLPCLMVLSSLSLDCRAARILAVFPTPSRSHVIAYEALTKELANRGHQVTVVSMFPQEKPLGNYTDIAIPKVKFEYEKIDLYRWKDIGFIDMLKTFSSMGEELCSTFLGHPKVQQLIQGPDDLYDLLIISFFNNECALGFYDKFKVPLVGVVPMGGMLPHFEMMGNPSPYSITPNIIIQLPDRMSFSQRVLNTLSLTVFQVMRHWMAEPEQDDLMRKYFNSTADTPYVMDLARKTSVVLLNTHVSILYARPYVPGIVEVGGMHLKPGATLPQDLKKYLDSAKHGVIYFSMGSNLKSANLPEEKRRAFLDAFSKMKQQVLWKWEEEELPGRPENVRLGKWLPQAAILAHPNVKVFITHGGLLSMQETVFNGVPMIAIPVFADQPLNAQRAENMGIGLKLDFENVTSESVQWAINTVVENPRYSERVKELSTRFRDQPTTPLERAVFWTEYVIRHKGAPHLRSPALSLSWYQYFLLDVLAVIILVPLLTLLLLYKVTRRLMCGSGSKHTDKLKTN